MNACSPVLLKRHVPDNLHVRLPRSKPLYSSVWLYLVNNNAVGCHHDSKRFVIADDDFEFSVHSFSLLP